MKPWLPLVLGIISLSACKHDPLYELNIAGGQGSGFYESEEKVELVADIPTGHRFLAWEGPLSAVADPSAAWTSVCMPSYSLDLSAYTLAVDTPSYRYEVRPIIQRNCQRSGCHLFSPSSEPS